MPRETFLEWDEEEYDAKMPATNNNEASIYSGPAFQAIDPDRRYEEGLRSFLARQGIAQNDIERFCPLEARYTQLHQALDCLARAFHGSALRARGKAPAEGRSLFHQLLCIEGYNLWTVLAGAGGEILFPNLLCIDLLEDCVPPVKGTELLRTGFYNGRIRLEWDHPKHWRLVVGQTGTPLMERTPWSLERERRAPDAEWEPVLNPRVRLYLTDLRWLKEDARPPAAASKFWGSLFGGDPLLPSAWSIGGLTTPYNDMCRLYAHMSSVWDKAIDDAMAEQESKAKKRHAHGGGVV